MNTIKHRTNAPKPKKQKQEKTCVVVEAPPMDKQHNDETSAKVPHQANSADATVIFVPNPKDQDKTK